MDHAFEIELHVAGGVIAEVTIWHWYWYESGLCGCVAIFSIDVMYWMLCPRYSSLGVTLIVNRNRCVL
jgi:hypothetical protein